MENARAASRQVRDQLVQSVDPGKLDEHVRALSQWDRLAGEPGAETAVDYIMDQLATYGITRERHRLDMYCSDPVKGEVQVIDPKRLRYAPKLVPFADMFPKVSAAT